MQNLIKIIMAVCAGHVACVGENVRVYTHGFAGENWNEGNDHLRDWGVVKTVRKGREQFNETQK